MLETYVPEPNIPPSVNLLTPSKPIPIYRNFLQSVDTKGVLITCGMNLLFASGIQLVNFKITNLSPTFRSTVLLSHFIMPSVNPSLGLAPTHPEWSNMFHLGNNFLDHLNIVMTNFKTCTMVIEVDLFFGGLPLPTLHSFGNF